MYDALRIIKVINIDGTSQFCDIAFMAYDQDDAGRAETRFESIPASMRRTNFIVDFLDEEGTILANKCITQKTACELLDQTPKELDEVGRKHHAEYMKEMENE